MLELSPVKRRSGIRIDVWREVSSMKIETVSDVRPGYILKHN